MIDWHDIDTVLLDMDGTLLDLNYDNEVWNRQLPRKYAEHHGVSEEDSRERLFSRMSALRGQLDFYCLDSWANFTRLDIVALHSEQSHLVQYRADAESFLDWLGAPTHRPDAAPIRSLIVTNAHPDSIAVKHEHTGLLDRVDHTISCHSYGSPKESDAFWTTLMEEHPFEPTRALLIDDNMDVLASADRNGIGHVLTVATPDSGKPARAGLPFRSFDRFAEILP